MPTAPGFGPGFMQVPGLVGSFLSPTAAQLASGNYSVATGVGPNQVQGTLTLGPNGQPVFTQTHAGEQRLPGLATGTPGAGIGVPVGEAGPEIMHLRPDGGVEIIPLARGAQGGMSLDPDKIIQGVLDLPALQAARRGAGLPAFQAFGGPLGIPEMGINDIPEPFRVAGTYLSALPSERLQLMDLYQAAGVQPDDVLAMMQRSVPGYRGATGVAFSQR